jgi:hypothetical protein
MAEVIKLFSEPDSRDELGLGTVRDALADLLFPGTSTIQTRARYFLFIPWVYLRHERRRTPSNEIAQRARRDEIKLIGLLQASQDRQGIIGAVAQESLERLPSAIYWSGLSVWGIRHYPGSQDGYHRHFDSVAHRLQRLVRDDDGNPTGQGLVSSWDPQLPEAPEDFLERAEFALREEEAHYLQQRLMSLRPRSLLAHLVSQTRPEEKLDFIWNHPEAEGFPPRLRDQVEHARAFSELMHGAALLYNAMIAQLLPNREDLATYYQKRFSDWAHLIESRPELHTWSREAFWSLIQETGAQVSIPTRRFIDTWLGRALERTTPAHLFSDAGVHEQIRRRELELKGVQRARLSNARARERWTEASGAEALGYRWFRARQISADILRGLET